MLIEIEKDAATKIVKEVSYDEACSMQNIWGNVQVVNEDGTKTPFADFKPPVDGFDAPSGTIDAIEAMAKKPAKKPAKKVAAKKKR